MPAKTFQRSFQYVMAAGWLFAVVGGVRAQWTDLTDFRYDPFANPKRAQFSFSRLPLFTQTAQREGNRIILVLECKGTRNVATTSNYTRPITGSEPISAVEILGEGSGPSAKLLIRLPLRGDVTPRVETTSSPPTIHVLFQPAGSAPPIRQTPTPQTATESVAPNPSVQTETPNPEKTDNSELGTRNNVLGGVEGSKPAETKPTPQPAEKSDATEQTAESQEEPQPERNTPIFGWMLTIGGGLLVVAVGFVGAGFLLVYGWTELRAFLRRRNAHLNRAAYQAAKEMNGVIARLREEGKEVEEVRIARHQAMLDALRRDLQSVRDTLASLSQEFEKATQSVVLLKPSKPARPTSQPTAGLRPAPTNDEEGSDTVRPTPTRIFADEPTELDAPRARRDEQTQRRSLEAWVSRVAGTLQSDASDDATKEGTGLRKSKSPTELAGLLLKSPTPEPSGESNPPTELYDRARQLLAKGQSPQDVADATGLPAGEVELLAQLSRIKRRDRSQDSGVEMEV